MDGPRELHAIIKEQHFVNLKSPTAHGEIPTVRVA